VRLPICSCVGGDVSGMLREARSRGREREGGGRGKKKNWSKEASGKTYEGSSLGKRGVSADKAGLLLI